MPRAAQAGAGNFTAVNKPPAAARSGEGQEKPGWSLTVVLVGAVSAVLRLTDTWSWWALLWAPLFIVAARLTAYEWRSLLRNGWRMNPPAWLVLIAAHLGFVASRGGVLGLLPY